MLHAYTSEESSLTKASPGRKAICPACNGEVLAKCGDINLWHWAHTAKTSCDSWSEPESAWHLLWKSIVPTTHCEVVIGCHRADIVNAYGVVIELQHSSLSPAEIREREDFYKNMVWVFDAGQFRDNITFYKDEGFYTFKWKWQRKRIISANSDIYIDLRNGFLFHPRNIHESGRGWGDLIIRTDFLNQMGFRLYRDDPLIESNIQYTSNRGILATGLPFSNRQELILEERHKAEINQLLFKAIYRIRTSAIQDIKRLVRTGHMSRDKYAKFWRATQNGEFDMGWIKGLVAGAGFYGCRLTLAERNKIKEFGIESNIVTMLSRIPNDQELVLDEPQRPRQES